MYRVSIELQKHEWKSGRTRNAVETRAAGKCFHSFFKFSQTFTSVSITRQKHGEHVFYFFQKTPRRKKGKQLVNFDYQSVNSLCSRHHYVNSSCQFCVSIEFYKTTELLRALSLVDRCVQMRVCKHGCDVLASRVSLRIIL